MITIWVFSIYMGVAYDSRMTWAYEDQEECEMHRFILEARTEWSVGIPTKVDFKCREVEIREA